MNSQDILLRLAAPFDPRLVEWRAGMLTKDKTRGLAFCYIDARTVADRLDAVCGPYWQCRYPFPGCCEIGIKIGDEWIWRSDGAGQTDFEGEKGQFSDAFKRAAVRWGVFRYGYSVPSVWVPVNDRGQIEPSQQAELRERLRKWQELKFAEAEEE